MGGSRDAIASSLFLKAFGTGPNELIHEHKECAHIWLVPSQWTVRREDGESDRGHKPKFLQGPGGEGKKSEAGMV